MSALGALVAVLGLLQAPAVEGEVRSAGGDPIPYAQIQVLDHSAADWTDANGQYRLEGLDRGRWRLRVMHTAHEPLDVEVVVPGDRPIRLDITLEARPAPTPDPLYDFEPFQVEYTLPALLNTEEVARRIQARYTPELVDRGIGGEAVMRLWLDERGQVVRGVISSSSGNARLDSIALAVSDRMRFRPARSQDQAVRVIVRIPVSFTLPDTLPVIEVERAGDETGR
ncbi:MAG: TonB family protein [Longimicrobiales bacterium]|nr:TonB family protein [Longimicrobiales bacterium]